MTLSRLVSNKPSEVYVRNRVNEIRSLLPDAEFVYVNKKENLSDLLSHGVSANMLENSSLWWEGSPWLNERNLLPLEEVELSFENSEYDEIGINVTQVVDDFDDLMNWERFSSFKKFVLTTVWVLRFITNVRKPVSQRKLQRIFPIGNGKSNILCFETATKGYLCRGV